MFCYTRPGHKWSQVFDFFSFSTFTTGPETEEGIQIHALPHLNLKINGPHGASYHSEQSS